MNQIVIYISGPEVAEAVGRFMPDLAKALAAEQARYGARYPQGILTGGTEETVPSKGETPLPAPIERKPRAKKAVEPEPAKTEAEETCLDVKPSVEVQQELELNPSAEAMFAEAPTIDDLRRHLRAYGQTHGAEALSSLYAEYGAKQLSDLPAEKYAEIIAKVSA